MFNIYQKSVTGECQVHYGVSRLPAHLLQSEPQLAPLAELSADEQFIKVVKTKNYTKCDQQPEYHFGLSGPYQWKSVSNNMADFISVSILYLTMIIYEQFFN